MNQRNYDSITNCVSIYYCFCLKNVDTNLRWLWHIHHLWLCSRRLHLCRRRRALTVTIVIVVIVIVVVVKETIKCLLHLLKIIILLDWKKIKTFSILNIHTITKKMIFYLLLLLLPLIELFCKRLHLLLFAWRQIACILIVYIDFVILEISELSIN